MSAPELTRAVPLGAAATHRIVALFERAVEAVAAWRRSRATVDALAELSDKQLADIGLTRGDIAEVAETLARR
jgi:uncharacterized protein YjiS (DUF1127 family)